MKDYNETQIKLLNSAKQEFLEKGYKDSSLRNICKNAGVTTGALYFFFKDKEDLFASLVEEPLNKLYEVMLCHYEEESRLINDQSIGIQDQEEDVTAAYGVIHLLYKYYDEFQLILTKSKGSKFENCTENFVAITEKHYRILADRMSSHLNAPKVDEYMIHWISHVQVHTFAHMITHESLEDSAIKHMGGIIKYLIDGWHGMFIPLEK